MTVTQSDRNREMAEQDTAGAGTGLAAPPRRHRGSPLAVAIWGPPAVVLGAVTGVWYLVTYYYLDPQRRFLLPPPHRVVQKGFLEWRNLSEILHGTWLTAQVALTGLFIAIVLGVMFAVLMSQAKWIERSLYPYAVIIQTTPILALVPLIAFWFGLNFRSRVLVCVLISIFPIITNTLFGLQSVDRGHHDLFTLHGAGRLTRLRKLQLPSALPAILTGFRISAGLSVIGAIVGEFFFRQGLVGIGRLIDRYNARLLPEQLFTAIFFAAGLGLVVFWFFGFLRTLVLRNWHESAGPDR